MRVIRIKRPTCYSEYRGSVDCPLPLADLRNLVQLRVYRAVYWFARVNDSTIGEGHLLAQRYGERRWSWHSLSCCRCGACSSPTSGENRPRFTFGGTSSELMNRLQGRVNLGYIAPLVEATHKLEQLDQEADVRLLATVFEQADQQEETPRYLAEPEFPQT